MMLSVILPTYNRAQFLDKALDSLTTQTFPRHLFEIIVVDNGSTDNTCLICEKYTGKFHQLKYYYDSRPGLHVGRHVGLENASGEILVYGDDDIRAFPTWLEEIADSFRDPKVALVGGKCVPEFESTPPVWFESLWSRTSDGKALGQYSLVDFGDEVKEISPYYVWGCNFSIRKSVLLECGGFHPDGMPKSFLRFRGDGETSISRLLDSQKKYKTLYNPNASVFHWVSTNRMTLQYIYQRSFAQGISDSYTIVRLYGSVFSFANLKKITKLFLRKYYAVLQNTLSDNQELVLAICSGFVKGYLYHQLEIIKDKKLLDWVIRDNYQGQNINLPL